MATDLRERLQPALLDRLTDEHPELSQDPEDRRGMNKAQLRAAVLRDLGWLLNAVQPMLPAEAQAHPLAADSVINFGMPPLSGQLASKIDKPPFYAVSNLSPGITLTFGGIMINDRAEVLEPDGRVIPGLFAAGEGAGHLFHHDYIGGGSLTNCLVMGRIAGREVAA